MRRRTFLLATAVLPFVRTVAACGGTEPDKPTVDVALRAGVDLSSRSLDDVDLDGTRWHVLFVEDTLADTAFVDAILESVARAAAAAKEG